MNEKIHDQLAHLLSGYWYTQTIYVAAKLGLAELLKNGPKSAEELTPGDSDKPQGALPTATGAGKHRHLRRGARPLRPDPDRADQDMGERY